MAVHLFSARRLAEDLAAGRVTPREQATYVAASSVLWLIPTYFYVAAWHWSEDRPFVTIYWWMEFAMLVLVNVGGIFYCLGQASIDPAKHFLVDFTCLWAPASMLWLPLTWALFHASVWGMALALPHVVDDTNWRAVERSYVRLHDMLLYFVIVGQVFATYWSVGRHMRRAAALRA